jgi:hypothetical protein
LTIYKTAEFAAVIGVHPHLKHFTAIPGQARVTASITLRSCENCGDSDDVIVDLRKNLAVHLVHEPSANVTSQPAATNVFRIYSAPKALENMRKIVLHKRTTTVKETSRSAMTASAAGCAKPGTEYPEKTSSWT